MNAVADTVNNDPAIQGRLKVVFVPDFSVKRAQRVYAAAWAMIPFWCWPTTRRRSNARSGSAPYGATRRRGRARQSTR
ncbi:MAG: glycogen/starch/alpha-glucan phosphorylase [Acetobacteraceae bacterium]|nr:glycogen/starch/alpha-glucan phosphorylase [Acetobacteraceae bacterium]